MGIPSYFSATFLNRDNFCDFLFAFLPDWSLLRNKKKDFFQTGKYYGKYFCPIFLFNFMVYIILNAYNDNYSMIMLPWSIWLHYHGKQFSHFGVWLWLFRQFLALKCRLHFQMLCCPGKHTGSYQFFFFVTWPVQVQNSSSDGALPFTYKTLNQNIWFGCWH